MMERAFSWAHAVLAGLIIVGGIGVPALADQPLVDKLILSDTIQPVTAAELDRALATANSDGAQALLIELDTPGEEDVK